MDLNASEQRELQSRLEKKQMKEFMKTYNDLVQHCFDECVNDFTTKALQSREQNCVLRCVEKKMKGTERLSNRFQEKNAEMMQSGGFPGT